MTNNNCTETSASYSHSWPVRSTRQWTIVSRTVRRKSPWNTRCSFRSIALCSPRWQRSGTRLLHTLSSSSFFRSRCSQSSTRTISSGMRCSSASGRSDSSLNGSTRCVNLLSVLLTCSRAYLIQYRFPRAFLIYANRYSSSGQPA